MIVCLCEGLNERAVVRRIEEGCQSVADLSRTCGAGGSCGACAKDLTRLVRAHGRRDASSPVDLPVAAK